MPQHGPATLVRKIAIALSLLVAGLAIVSTDAGGLSVIGAEIAEYWFSGRGVELWVNEAQLRAIAAHDDVQWVDRWTRTTTFEPSTPAVTKAPSHGRT